MPTAAEEEGEEEGRRGGRLSGCGLMHGSLGWGGSGSRATRQPRCCALIRLMRFLRYHVWRDVWRGLAGAADLFKYHGCGLGGISSGYQKLLRLAFAIIMIVL